MDDPTSPDTVHSRESIVEGGGLEGEVSRPHTVGRSADLSKGREGRERASIERVQTVRDTVVSLEREGREGNYGMMK